MEQRCHRTYSILCRGYLHIGYVLSQLLRHVFAQDGLGSQLDGFRNEFVSVYLRTLHGYKQTTGFHLTGVYLHSCDFHLGITCHTQGFHVLQQLIQYHRFAICFVFLLWSESGVSLSSHTMPGLMRVPAIRLCSLTLP